MASKEDNKEAYTWENVHEDLENKKVAGCFGGDNCAYWGLAGLRAGIDMKNWHGKRSPDEFYVDSLDKLLKRESTRVNWDRICTLDPLGLYSNPPTMSATESVINMPEVRDSLVADGKIVDPIDMSVQCVKIAIDYVWNVPLFSERIGQKEGDVRQALYDYTHNPEIKDPELKTFLPPVGGCTVYICGDINQLNKKGVEVCVRVHDACCGSDVFGTDICTCRPYLAFAVKAIAECAQRGGVGIIVYFRKEGRSLGEVTKYRVYNARKMQEGGDRPEKYFFQTESIAGIRDARFQELMPDVLNFLGLTRIDWLCSMSNEKYEAITAAGIEVMQRVALPDVWVPKNADVEITAKIASGYHSDTIDSDAILEGLRGLPMIRQQCTRIFDLAKEGKSVHFNIDMTKLTEVTNFVIDVTKEFYPDVTTVPYHSRWRHFDEKDLVDMVAKWPCDAVESARRKIDLVTVSVLLDAGAGDKWRYRTKRDESVSRSEGLGLASFDMFEDGYFSSDPDCLPCRVNACGLKKLTLKQLATGLQVRDDTNPLVGLSGRFELLQDLGLALKKHPQFFGAEVARPGNIVDYVLKHCDDNKQVSLRVLWKAVIEGYESIWPKNNRGVRKGDVWCYTSLNITGVPGSDLVPFHKLSQWMTYSLLEPMEELGIKFTDMNLLTGLAEYRNGGLLIDGGMIIPKGDNVTDMTFNIGAELVVEWRALTVIMLDKLHEEALKILKLTPEEFPLAKLLQGGTWMAGRRMAAKFRPETNNPPIKIRSDGTVF